MKRDVFSSMLVKRINHLKRRRRYLDSCKRDYAPVEHLIINHMMDVLIIVLEEYRILKGWK